jgi:hypothetical protein
MRAFSNLFWFAGFGRLVGNKLGNGGGMGALDAVAVYV